MFKTNPFVPAFSGTTGLNSYIMVLATVLGRLGFTKDGSSYRIRVEPADQGPEGLAALTGLDGWKSGVGGKQYRKSTMAYTVAALHDALRQGATALLNGGNGVSNGELPADLAAVVNALPGVTVWAEPDAPVVSEADQKAVLVARVKELKLPGWQFAASWKLATLEVKVAQAAKPGQAG